MHLVQSNFHLLKRTTLLLLIITSTLCYSQDVFKDKNLEGSYENYALLPREIAYLHLNKSTYIKGEYLGFSGYVLDKSSKRLSGLTTNLYCVISDKEEKVIKSKLVRVENGITNDLFELDSLFTSGEYIIKAYTNWMKNFNEQNFYAQSFRVIDPDIDSEVSAKIIESNIDAQFLPEGGHLVSDIQNTVGVILKNKLGLGVPMIEGELIDDTDKIITTFKVNQLGIGRFSFTPLLNRNYRIQLSYLNEKHIFNIEDVEPVGIALSLKKRTGSVILSIKTNQTTISQIKDKQYKLAIHNGQTVTESIVIFNKELEINKLISEKDLSSGVNIFTLFDDTNTPIAERLYFNYSGIQFLKSGETTIKKELDSLVITIPFQNIDSEQFNNISISVLPEDTKSYSHHHNLASYSLLQPYVKGTIENAKYYFTDVDRRKEYELDNLLLTQGWSSYSWNTIFNYPPKDNYYFENGIGFKANINKSQTNNFVIHPTGGERPEYIFLSEDEKSFERSGFFTLDGEKISISEVREKGDLKPPSLLLQYFPSQIPELNLAYKYLSIKEPILIKSTNTEKLVSSGFENDGELLDVVELSSNVKQTKIQRIRNKSYGKIDMFGDIERNKNQSLTDYLRQRGYIVSDTQGNLKIYVSDVRSIMLETPSPTVYLDGHQLYELSVLSDYSMDLVDYIDINKHGVGEGIRGGGGTIKIFTDPTKQIVVDNSTTIKEYKVPLTFSNAKKYYAPQYEFYQSDFFYEYGVIGWLPKNSINSDGSYSFKILNTQTSGIKLFIEGITSNGSLISEVITITTN
ncbi:hypothetical protein [Urechidicola croceus]|uniref:TonB-dependent receptor plug domain-containing protein n=1 Tax=Urechidicola croceus TaxID=1850246 RepID=A0A1D8P9Q1_9FLAO|nr:hypothetical protein [Urechidicola croceus]AOW21317.1 hypothetical protein LPB138_11785 [Urechidicola croceus]